MVFRKNHKACCVDKALVTKLTVREDNQQFISQSLCQDLGLSDIVPGRYFDKSNILDKSYEKVKIVKSLFPNFHLIIVNDWKFL